MDAEDREQLLKPITDAWIGVVGKCADSNKAFRETARMCRNFFAGAAGFMWEDSWRERYMGKGSVAAPKFRITINKAFELVAVVGPYLYWQYPHRAVKSYQPIDITPDIIGDPNDPFVQEMWQFISAKMEREERINTMRNSAMERVLNYLQRELPGGGLEMHSQLAITEALVTGRGCLWTEPYRYPGSDTMLVGSTFSPTSDLFVDPDCTDPTLSNALFVIRRHRNSSWDVEKKFGLQRGSLKGKGTYESGVHQGGNENSSTIKTERRNSQANDMIEWFEVFSKCGVGTRLRDARQDYNPEAGDIKNRFDEVVGDYARICVARGVDYPLNAPPERLLKASEEEVQAMFDWPVPYWKDGRWPVSTLDFYRDTAGCWPIAPIAPGLGELICINVLASVATTQAFENSRQIIGYLASAAQHVEDALRSTKSPVLVKLADGAHKSVSDCIQYLQKPEINGDVWKTIDWLSMTFDKRTGLSELLYAMNAGGVQSRSAKDAEVKQTMASVRPEYMAKQVAKHQTNVAENERIACGWVLKSSDVASMIGPAGAMVWEKFVENERPEIIFREMRCSVEADDVKKPNVERDQANAQQGLNILLPELSKHADVTGDTGPANAVIQRYCDAIQFDGSDLVMGERVPMPPDPQMVEMQQQQMQLEMAKMQADAEKSQMDAQAKAADVQIAQQQAEREALQADQQMQLDAASRQMELQFDQAKGEQQLQLEREKAALQMQVEKAKAVQQIQLQQVQGQQQVAMGQQKMAMQAEQHRQAQTMKGVEFASNLTQSRMNHAQAMTQSREKAKADIAAKKKAKAKSGAK